jgi:hypothetical protein
MLQLLIRSGIKLAAMMWTRDRRDSSEEKNRSQEKGRSENALEEFDMYKSGETVARV